MFKFVVACAVLAVAAATPDVILSSPIAYSTGIAPAVTTYSAGGLINPAPLVYSAPAAYSSNIAYTHLIKKRSPGLIAPIAPLATSYAAYGAPLAASYAAPAHIAYSAPLAGTYSAPLVHSAPVYSTAHLIKKRAAPLIAAPAAYIASGSYAAAPLVSTYSSYPAAATVVSSPYYSAGPLAYTQFIKK